jgi:hypothetical protein
MGFEELLDSLIGGTAGETVYDDLRASYSQTSSERDAAVETQGLAAAKIEELEALQAQSLATINELKARLYDQVMSEPREETEPEAPADEPGVEDLITEKERD